MIERGILCLAQNNSTTDYVRLAYLQCLSVKLTNPDLPYALLTDQQSLQQADPQQIAVFDHVVLIENDEAEDQEWKQRNSWQMFNLTPFRETIKVEADLLFTRNIGHWWRTLRLRDVVVSQGCRDYLGNIATARTYRGLHDQNSLPDLYTGLMYWRRSQTAYEYFEYARRIYQDWDNVAKTLIACRDPGSNDAVFAVAAKLIGPEQVTLPQADFFQITHMKPAINHHADRANWLQELNIETVPPYIRVRAHDQIFPFHYHDKNWATDKILEKYEYEVGIRKSN